MDFARLVTFALAAAAGYAGLGVLVAAAAHFRGLGRLDPAAQHAGLGFRLLITPGLVCLWPVILVRVFRPGIGSDSIPDRGPSPRALRRTHALAWKLAAVTGPLVVGVALAVRPDSAAFRLPASPVALPPLPPLNSVPR